MSPYVWILLLGLITGNIFVFSLSCMEEGMKCSKTLKTHCCGELICHLTSAFTGTCKRCLPVGAFCLNSSECCSRKCILKCK
ncbi:hypothetical protein CSKR_111845 [Clonorchis sinensis]|uniref:Uncharacterized protein n=2 Tax=Clonorchis sinensis TaxID=79923 RepID=G7Y4U0_CLOSI|nr:hypothetical protein CSKR_111845 [Clonorchis sinensis]GAA47976.1 hypothetical protein CLF_101035 [Clonorchis sinensis]